jgi:site-specific DNA-methyltransferase (adenine-specific)
MAAKGQKQLSRCHDVIFWYSKSKKWTFKVDEIRLAYAETSKARAGYKKTNLGGGAPKSQICELNENGKFPEDWVQIPFIRGKEYLGYPTQKPEALLERIIKASSNEGDTVLDAYCGCGTTVVVAEKLKRKWVGIDITYQSVSLIIKRLQDTYGEEIIQNFELNGIPKDMNAAVALAHKKDDRVRKEFEKWTILTYTNNYAYINEKKGSDRGIDGRAFMAVSAENTKEVLFSVKSGEKVGVSDIRDFRGVLDREENAVTGVFITLKNPTKDMISEAKDAGIYVNPFNNQPFDKIKIVTVESIIGGERLYLPLPKRDVVKRAESSDKSKKIDIEF